MKRVTFTLLFVVLAAFSLSFLSNPSVSKAQDTTIGQYDGNTCFASFAQWHWWGNRWFISHCDLESGGSPVLEMVRGIAADWYQVGYLVEPFEKYLEFLSSYDRGNGIQLDISWANGLPIGVRSN
jgi:hypothetical protein